MGSKISVFVRLVIGHMLDKVFCIEYRQVEVIRVQEHPQVQDEDAANQRRGAGRQEPELCAVGGRVGGVAPPLPVTRGQARHDRDGGGRGQTQPDPLAADWILVLQRRV